MNQQQKVYEASIVVEVPVHGAFSLINSASAMSEILGKRIVNSMSYADGGASGTISIGNTVFESWARPYDIDLNREEIRFRLRVSGSEEGCRIMLVILCRSSMVAEFSNEKAERILLRIKKYAESHRDALPDYPPETVVSEASPSDNAHNKSTGQSSLVGKVKKRLGRKARLIRTVIVSLLLVALLITGISIATIKKRVRKMSDYTDLSAAVTLEAALAIPLGTSRGDVANKLETNGVSIGNSRYVYRSEEIFSNGLPAKQIMVAYDGDNNAESVRFLDVAVSHASYEPAYIFSYDIPAGSTLDAIIAQVAVPASMIVVDTNADGVQQMSIHFGYLDPFADFDPAWRGSFVVIENLTDGSISSQMWAPYDPADSTVTRALESGNITLQYGKDEYSQCLEDKYIFERLFLLTNLRYTKGDLHHIFGRDAVQYDTTSGYSLYGIDSDTLLESGEPRWSYSIAYDYAGQFRMAAFTNRALLNLSGVVAKTAHENITRGMSYKEVRQIMGIFPTSIQYDSSGFTFCYGRRLDSDVAEEQFEFIVRFDAVTMISTNVYVNSGVSQVQDSQSATANEAA